MSEKLEERVRALERGNRRLRVGLAAMLLVTLAAGVVGFGRDPGDLQGRSLTLVSDDGAGGARLQMEGSALRIRLLPAPKVRDEDPAGGPTEALRATVQRLAIADLELRPGPALTLHDGTGREVLRLGEPAIRRVTP